MSTAATVCLVLGTICLALLTAGIALGTVPLLPAGLTLWGIAWTLDRL